MELVFSALAETNRRKIVEILKKGAMTVQDISTYFSFSGATLSHHLRILKHANLVIAERQGQFIFYSLNTSVFDDILKAYVDLFTVA